MPCVNSCRRHHARESDSATCAMVAPFQPSIQTSTGTATTGLGQAGMRAYAKWQGLNPDLQSSAGGPAGLADMQLSRPRPSSFPQPGGYDATLAARPQVSTGTYGQGGVSNQDGSPPTFAWPAMQNDR